MKVLNVWNDRFDIAMTDFEDKKKTTKQTFNIDIDYDEDDYNQDDFDLNR